ncbi:hypothetical protein BTA51_07085 [Hahella sp. CCB-MM4]|uniref:Ig-like domain-containing protein n=1 Tax=Hahella sp. (strain CCB-MM4) TaxID=1926491 RepID=UPI000B9ADFE9|nr:Ig-like domain-containing protein [Hahella sp. CCB-MM4]OZG74730.1 hypothetical protein BTA51_07085 [Hahella sp. CCB-MM4]
MLKYLPFLSLVSLLSACGGGGGGSSENNAGSPPSILTGQLVDSAVKGVSYETPTTSGITNSKGEFHYREGESIEFRIGNIRLNSVPVVGQVIHTPVSLTGASKASDSSAITIMQLLQSLDEDRNPDNGIAISDQVRARAEALSDEVSADTISSNLTNIVANLTMDGRVVVSPDIALNHYFETAALMSNEIGSDQLGHSFPQFTDLLVKPSLNDTHSARIEAILDSATGAAYATAQFGDGDEILMDQLDDSTYWFLDRQLDEIENQTAIIRLKSIKGIVIASYFSGIIVTPDIDNDGVENSLDALPFDGMESVDTDNDGIGNNLDPDDDGDGIDDAYDDAPLDSSVFDTTAPRVISTEPKNGDRTTAGNLTIGATFSERMLPTSITDSAFVLSNGKQPIPALISYDEDSKSAFLTPISDLVIGQSYTARLSADISDLQQNTLGDAYIWSFEIEGSWGDVEPLTEHSISDDNLIFSVDRNGNGILFWYEANVAWVSRYDDEGNLVDMAKITESSDPLSVISVSTLTDDSAKLLWIKRVDDTRELWITSYSFESGEIKSSLLYQTENDQRLNNIQIAFNDSGQGILSFGVGSSEPSNGILIGLSFNGKTWSNPTLLSNKSDDYWGWVNVDIDDDGNALTIWDTSTGEGSVKAIYYKAGEGWEEAQILSTATSQSPKVSFISPGKAIAVWGDFQFTGKGIQWASFTPEAGWSDPKKVTDANANNSISLVSDDSGRALIAWSSWMSGDFYTSEYADGGEWSEPYALDPHTRYVLSKLQALPSGGFAVVWRERDRYEYSDLKAAIYRDGIWGLPTVLNDIELNAGNFGLNVLSNGEIWVNWEQGMNVANPGPVIRKYH